MRGGGTDGQRGLHEEIALHSNSHVRPIAIHESPEKYHQNCGNLVRVAPFEGAANDDELRSLLRYLIELSQFANIRSVEKRGWRRRYDSAKV